MYNLNGKVALVTGAGGKYGIGRAIAVRLAQDGANVVVNDVVENRVDTPDWAGLSSVVAEIEALGRRSQGIIADVSNSTQVSDMVQRVLTQFGHIDILINNAGIPAGQDRVPVVDLKEAVWDRLQAINVKGTFLCSQAVARAMIARGKGGRIINMSSISGIKGSARFAAYCASKFAVRGLSQVLAQELGPHQINVHAICPALIETERVTDMAAVLKPEGISTEDFQRQMIARTNANNPLGRIGQADDVAKTVAFLCSSEADYLTGLSVPVAGGSYMD